MRGLLSIAVIALCLAGCSSGSGSQIASGGYRGGTCTNYGGSSLVPSGGGCGGLAQTVF